MENKASSKVYIDVLASYLLPDVYSGEILQQENVPSHKWAQRQTWFFENAVDTLENCPPISPDLNVIKKLWSIQESKVRKRHPKNLDDFENFVLEEFSPVPDDYIEKNFNSLKNHFIMTIKNGGGFTRN